MGVLVSSPRFVSVPGFVPTDIAGIKVWYDSDDAASFTYSSGSVVSQWDDKSGNGLHMVQGTVTNQPSRTGTRNARSTVVFDGVDNFMTYASSLSLGMTNLSVFLVAVETTIVVSCGFLVAHPGSGSDFNNAAGFSIDGSSGFQWGVAVNGVFPANGANNILPLSNIGFTKAEGAGNLKTYQDGTAGATGAGSATGTATSLVLGARYSSGAVGAPYLTGEIAEVLIYDTVLGTTDRQSVESYLKTKWNTP